MRTRSERSFAVLPFSLGCTSCSSVSLGSSTYTTQAEKLPPQAELNANTSLERRREKGDHESSSSRVKRKKSLGFWVLPKFNIFIGLQKLVGSLRNLSQIFVYKEQMDEKEEEEEEMEIGFPTDVKHVTHIGLDGSTMTMATINGPEIKSWENLKANPHELLPFPSSISLKQFELAMAAQAHDRPPPLDAKLSGNLKA